MAQQPYDFAGAIFHFFKVFGRRPAGTMWVGFWNAILYVLLGVVVLWAMWPFYEQIFTLAANDREPGLSEVWTMLASISGGLILAMLGGIAVSLMAQGAWMRLLARDEVAPLIPLRFGTDEFRLLGVNIVFIALGTAAYILGSVVVGVTVFATVSTGDGGGAAGAAGGLIAGLVVLALIAAGIFLAVKFAPAPALTVLDRRFRLFEAWPATKGVFWWALLTYIVMLIIIFIVAMVAGSMVQLLFLPAFFPIFAEFAQYAESGGDMTPQQVMDTFWAGLTHPVSVVFILLGTVASLILQTFYEGMWHSVGAYLARRHRGLETPTPAPVAAPPNTGDASADSGSSSA